MSSPNKSTAMQTAEVTMSSNTCIKPNVIRSLLVGQVIAVGIAHTYQKDYGWSNYSEANYIIEKVNKKEIIGRSEKFRNEMIRISQKDLDDYRFELRCLALK